MDDELVEEMVLAERTLIAEDICEWFEIVFKSAATSRTSRINKECLKGQLIGLVYALRTCKYLSDDDLGNLTDILIFTLPIKRLEDHDSGWLYFDRGYDFKYFQ